MYPFVKVMEWISGMIVPEPEEAAISREEVSAIANVAEEEEVLEIAY